MGSKGHHVYSKTWDSIVFGIIIVAFAVGLVLVIQAFFDEQSFQALIKTFDLTESDVYMIPVGALLFYIFWKAFEVIVFNRFLKLFEEREAAGEGAETSADSKLEEAKMLTADFEQKIHAARVEFTKEKIAQVDAAKKAAGLEVATAQQQAETSLQEHRQKISEQAERISQDLDSQVDDLSRELSEKIKQKPTPLRALS